MAKYESVSPDFTPDEAKALLAAVRAYESFRRKVGGASDPSLVGAASRLYGVHDECGRGYRR
jgi:hypothetical protein